MSEIEREDIAAIRYAAACAKDLFPHVTIDPTIDPATAIEICDLALRALDQAADARLGAAVRAQLPRHVRGEDYEPTRSILAEPAMWLRAGVEVGGDGWIPRLVDAIAAALREESPQ